ncbi:TIGR04222 domain-containing membrane protein, partial [Streptomyces sp. SID8111]|nr:TIGR04222 domain-containing membrane protein [Streptomyces sp. SID8111]
VAAVSGTASPAPTSRSAIPRTGSAVAAASRTGAIGDCPSGPIAPITDRSMSSRPRGSTTVAMARQRRLLLAHTGWATVVDPRGRDDMERSVIGAIGPEGQSPIAPVRDAAATAEPVRGIADRLVGAGLAVPDTAAT